MYSPPYTKTYTYDQANQLGASTIDGKTTNYKYDAAGRMVQAGSKTYRYKYLDKVAEVRENGKVIAEFEYTVEGQVSTATYGDKTEEFMWDGLALIQRNDISYLNEPYVTGGNPIIADNDVMFNDMLGNTVAINGKSIDMTAFGETENTNAMFTGKPHVAELGYTFLFRNYDSSLGKWSTSDPLGYPDGWNNFAYCNNGIVNKIDPLGGSEYSDNAFAIWSTLCKAQPATQEAQNALANIQHGYYMAIMANNPYANITNLSNAINSQIGTINSILTWNPNDLNGLPNNWQEILGGIGYQINSGVNNTTQILSSIQNVLQVAVSSFDAFGNIIAGREYNVIGSILEYGSSVAPYGTGSFLSFYANVYNEAIAAAINIGLFYNNTLEYINAFCDAVQHNGDYLTEYTTLMNKLRNAGFWE